MKSFLFNAAMNAGLDNSSLPLWAIARSHRDYVGPMTRHEHLVRTAAVAQSSLGYTDSMAKAAKRARSTEGQAISPIQRPSHQTRTLDVNARPLVMTPTPNQLMLDAQHVDLNEPGAIRWLEKLLGHDHEDVQDAAAEALLTRAIPHLLQKSLAGSSAETLHLLALAEHPHDAISSLALDSLTEEVIPKLADFVSDGYAAKAPILQHIAKSPIARLSEAASQALKQSAERPKSADAALDFEWID